MQSDKEYDILIVGGGPAGISTWLHLHKYAPELAKKAILIEKAQYPRDKVCGGALLNVGQKVLDQLGISLSITSVPIHKAEYQFGRDVFCHEEKNFMQIIRRKEFDYELAKVAMKRGLRINQGETFIDFSHSNKNLTVKTTKNNYNVKVLVGADGAASKVRNKMNLPICPRFATALEVFTPMNPKYDPEFVNNSSLMDFSLIDKGLQGYVWHFPCIIKGMPYMNHGICDCHINKKKSRPNIKKMFSDELHKRHINIHYTNWSGWPVPWFEQKPELSKEHILLVGDAAGIEPLIGGGIHLSLMYGNIASNLIIKTFDENDFSFREYNSRLQENYLGKYIHKFTNLAKEIYENKIDPIDAIKMIITKSG